MNLKSLTPADPALPKVFLALPHYGDLCAGTMMAVITASQRCFPAKINGDSASLLAHNFNRSWCAALNEKDAEGLTHFAMLHSDMAPDPGWLDVMLDEMNRTGADVLSAVVPIKDARGLTSTGWQDPATSTITRFTMTEAYRFPRTFDVDATGHPGMHLMVNTGCWVARLDRPWVDSTGKPGGFPGFNVEDVIACNGAGLRVAHVLPEDWKWSAWLARNGVKVMATTAVKLGHHGQSCYRNDTVWGTWTTDRGDGAPEEPARLAKAADEEDANADECCLEAAGACL